MSPWKIIDNSFFHLIYNSKQAHFKFLWAEKIYSINFYTARLVNDTMPHHKGIYYNWSDKQLQTLSLKERIAELSRRNIERKRSRA